MGNLDHQMTKDNATGIYMDGVPVGRNQGLAADIADLERVELLRGPQGTLYGRNTTAGAINFITRKPEKDFSFSQQLGFGNYDQFTAKTTLNVPVNDMLLTRLVYMRSSKDGWVKNTNNTLPNQIDFNKDDKEAIRLGVRLLATRDFTVDYGFDHSYMKYGNSFYQVVGGATAVAGRQESIAPKMGMSPSDIKALGHSLTLTWNIGDIQLKSITGYRELDNNVFQNYINFFTQYYRQKEDQTSQEFQLIGKAFNKRVDYVLGLFYYDENGTGFRQSNFAAGKDVHFIDAQSKSKAIYGQASWTPPVLDERLRFTLGGRYTQDTRKASKTFVQTDLGGATPGTVVRGDRDYSKFNPAFTIDYGFSDNVTGYAKYSTGYRAGGFNSNSTAKGFGDGFAQENVRAYELGMKSDLLERRLRFNAAAFLNKYSDLQVDQVRVPAIFTDTVNAGKAKIKGVELETTALVAKGFTANLSYTYMEGKYGSYVDNGVDLASVKHLQNMPRNLVIAGLQYESERMAYGKLVFNLDHRWQDQFYSGPNANTLNNSHSVWNARLQLADIRMPKGTARISLWGRNLTDKVYTTATTNLGLPASVFGEPRTYGLDLIYDY
jgi:iron complex outermembrane receptor protein